MAELCTSDKACLRSKNAVSVSWHVSLIGLREVPRLHK